MSDRAEDDPRIDAGLRVLGLLDGAELRALGERAAADASVAAEIAAWELRLAPLALIADPVPPPAALWDRIAHSLDADQTLLTPPNLTRQLSFWRGATAASLALAAGIAAVAFLGRGPVDPGLVAALSPAGSQAPTFLVRAADGHTLLVRAVATVSPIGNDRDLQLWSLAEGTTIPVSLGVLPSGGAEVRIAAAPTDRTKLLLSLEPRGGSPTGQPTGPVVYSGQLARLD